MKNVYIILLPLTVFVAVVTSQPLSRACANVENELAANEACLNAIIQVGFFVDGLTDVTRDELNTYCSSTCRDLNLRVSANCDDEPVNQMVGQAALDLVCTVNGDENCIDLLRSPQLAAVNNALTPSGDCPDLESDGTCSEDCAQVIENFVTVGGCCAQELVNFESIYGTFNVSYNQTLSFCNIDPPQFTPCEVINGAEGPKAITYSGLLLVAVMAVTMF